MFAIPFMDAWLKGLKPNLYDDVIDRLNYCYTAFVLLFFSLLVSAKQYVGSPIQCVTPAEFKGSWEQYAENYCFIQNTYYVPIDHQIPEQIERRIEREIGYYQWVPIVLAMQAMLFFLPNLVWKTLCWQSGIDLKTILDLARDSAKKEPEECEKQLTKLARYIENNLGLQREVGVRSCRGWLCVRWGKHLGSYLSYGYLLIKVLYLANAIGQFFLLNQFIDDKYMFWGIEIFRDLIQHKEWQDNGYFPRVTLCDFQMRKVGNVHRYTVECVLMINMLNEKIYIFVWFWLFMVASVTAANLLVWLGRTFSCCNNERTIIKLLRISHDLEGGMADIRTISRFAKNALRPDGVLLLRFISGHAGELVAGELTDILFKDYVRKLRTQVECHCQLGHGPDNRQNALGVADVYDQSPKECLDGYALIPPDLFEHSG